MPDRVDVDQRVDLDVRDTSGPQQRGDFMTNKEIDPMSARMFCECPHARHLVLIPNDSNPWSGLAVVETPGVWTLSGILIELLHERFEYKNDLASRWFPLGKNVPIVVDPR